jgi:hypothetical protein
MASLQTGGVEALEIVGAQIGVGALVTPAGVMRPIRVLPSPENQRLPSGPLTILWGL